MQPLINTDERTASRHGTESLPFRTVSQLGEFMDVFIRAGLTESDADWVNQNKGFLAKVNAMEFIHEVTLDRMNFFQDPCDLKRIRNDMAEPEGWTFVSFADIVEKMNISPSTRQCEKLMGELGECLAKTPAEKKKGKVLIPFFPIKLEDVLSFSPTNPRMLGDRDHEKRGKQQFGKFASLTWMFVNPLQADYVHPLMPASPFEPIRVLYAALLLRKLEFLKLPAIYTVRDRNSRFTIEFKTTLQIEITYESIHDPI